MGSEKPVVRLKVAASKGNFAAFAVLIVLMGYVCVLITAGLDFETRTRLVYYWVLFSGGIFAVAPPHVLLPDPHMPFMQLANRSRGELLSHQLKRWMPALVGLSVPGLILAFNDPGQYTEMPAEKSVLFAENLFVVLGTGLYSFAQYMEIGPVSQAWQEGSKGQAYRTYKRYSSPLSMPEGMVPAFLATVRVYTVCILTLMADVYAGRLVSTPMGWVPGLGLLLWSVVKLMTARRSFDRLYYHTNSFYGEIFPPGGGRRDDSLESLRYRSVYWVPRRWGPQTWISLLQMDRRLPLGRYVFLGHLLLWILFLQDAGGETIAEFLVLFILVKNASVHALTAHRVAPRRFQVTWQSPIDWILTRTFVNLRWTFPFLLSLLVVAFLDSQFRVADAVFWTMIDVVGAFLASCIVTYTTEIQFKKHVQ